MPELTDKMVSSSVVDAAVEPQPIDPADIVSGSPDAATVVLRMSDDGTQAIGVWHCTPGVFYLPHDMAESLTLIEGRVTVTPDGGEPSELGPGDTAFFPAGNRVLWDVHETIRKSWHLYDPTGEHLSGS